MSTPSQPMPEQLPEQLPESLPEIPQQETGETPSAPGRFQRMLYALFSPETRTGRIMRPVLRWVAAIIGLFTLGLLTGYLVLYQPVLRQRDSLSDQVKWIQGELQARETTLAAVKTDNGTLQKKLTQSEADLETARAKNDLLWVLDGVNNARVALVNKDGVAAKAALDQAQVDLARVLAYIEKADKSVAEVTKSRLELAVKELVIDPQAAQTDLNKLQSDLVALIKKLFK